MRTTIAVDHETKALLDRLARSRGRSKSEIVREALVALDATRIEGDTPSSVYDMVQDLVGIAKDGPSDLARSHKKAFVELLTERAKK